MSFSFDLLTSRKRRVLSAVLVAGVATAGAGGAATIHRLTVSQATGSEGATAFVQNSSTGAALQGEVAASANTGLRIPFGVLGEYDAAGSTFGIGVAGISTTGYAVGAESFGTNPTVEVLAEGNGHAIQSFTSPSSNDGAYAIDAVAQGAGDGIDAIAQHGGWGGYFDSSTGIGVEAISDGTSGGNSAAIYGYQGGSAPAGYFNGAGTGNAVYAVAVSTSGAGVVADDSIGSRGILGDTTDQAVVGFGHSGNTAAVMSAIDAVGGTRLFETRAYNSGNETPSFIVQAGTANRSGDAVAAYSTDVEASGDLYVYGKIYQNCQAFPTVSTTACEPVTSGSATTGSAVTRTARGDVEMYGSRQSVPTVEDEGTAQLLNGRAIVRLDPAFARTMAMDRPYRVFVTPKGPSRGVYVTNLTPQGFEVDENPGGRSSLAFDFRIVGSPFGDRSTRLAMVPKKVAQPSAPDPAAAGLRAQAAAVRAFDLNHERAESNRMLQRHTVSKAPAAFASLTGLRTH